jgi:hypothetical protein
MSRVPGKRSCFPIDCLIIRTPVEGSSRKIATLGADRMETRVFVLWAITAIALPAQIFTTLSSFDITDGAQPTAGLVQATSGEFYGTTYEGGAIDSYSNL